MEAEPTTLHQRVSRRLPFALVALVGQLSAAWPPGPTDMREFWASCAFLAATFLLMVPRRAVPLPAFVVPATVYMASVALLMQSTGGVASGLGSLMLIPVVGVALYGRRWESVCIVAVVLAALLSVSLANPHLAGSTERRVFLFGVIATMLSFAIQTLRSRLTESNDHERRLVQQEETINTAARELVQLSEPPAIMALGVRLAAHIASPRGTEICRATYFRIEEGMVVAEAQCDDSGLQVDGRWPLRAHPGLRDAVATLRPVAGAIPADEAGPDVRAALAASGVTHGAWVPVCPDGTLHGVLGIASRGAPVPTECLDRCVALGHFLELALANWAAHQELARQATADERRRIARELHDGLAHELAFIASKTRGARAGGPTTLDPHELAGAADRALDEARRAITVLSVTRPQSLVDAIAQTAEDLGSRLGMAVELALDEGVEVPGEVTENLLRIVREAMTNAATHGASEHVRVTLERADRLQLVVEDDGCGFDPEHPPGGGSFGLLGMEERAASVGADLYVHSSPDRGTRVAVAFR